MKAFVLRSYGSPDVLELTDLDTPVPGPGEVLVRVRATSVQPYDWHHMRGEPYVARLMGGTLGPRRIRRDEIQAAFADGWTIVSIESSVLETTIGFMAAGGLGSGSTPDGTDSASDAADSDRGPQGAQAWLAIIERD